MQTYFLDIWIVESGKDIMSNVGDEISAPNAGWNFGGDVPKTFDSHVRRSVPLYKEGHDLTCRISDYFMGQNSQLYDLGTSTGELLNQLAKRHQSPDQKFVGIDRENGMLELARKKCGDDTRIRLELAEMSELELEKSDMVVSYYTIQFIRPAFRQRVISQIYESLNWGGAFLLFEKVRGPDARFQDILTGIYNDYKLEQGFSSEEIIAKARSLKGVLEPFSTQGNYDLLERAGFKDCMTVMKYLCFEGILAIK